MAWPRKEINYASTVTADDANIGKVLAALDDTNQACNTLVLFASDNGAQSQGHSWLFFRSSGHLSGYTIFASSVPSLCNGDKSPSCACAPLSRDGTA